MVNIACIHSLLVLLTVLGTLPQYNSTICPGVTIASARQVTTYSRYKQAVSNNIRVKGVVGADEDPRVCYSDLPDTVMIGNKTVEETPGYFVCPYKESDKSTHTYCCGPSTRQQCCAFWDDAGRSVAAGLSILFGSVFGIVMICYGIAKCVSKQKPIKEQVDKVYNKLCSIWEDLR